MPSARMTQVVSLQNGEEPPVFSPQGAVFKIILAIMKAMSSTSFKVVCSAQDRFGTIIRTLRGSWHPSLPIVDENRTIDGRFNDLA